VSNSFRDVIYALRQVRKNPLSTSVVILSLALGIGSAATVFAVAYSLLFDTYPYKNVSLMAQVQLHTKQRVGLRLMMLNGSEFEQVKSAHSVQDAIALDRREQTMRTNELPVSVTSTVNTPNFFDFMGVPPLIGREFTLTDSDRSAAQTAVVLSYLFWQRQFGGNPGVLGTTIQLDQQAYTVIGVLPPRFTWADADIYLPGRLSSDPRQHWVTFVKLRPEVSNAAVRQELQSLINQWSKTDPIWFLKDFHVDVTGINQQTAGRFQRTLLLLFLSVHLLLAIGCANAAVLLLARSAARHYEIALRTAMGATAGQIVRQLLTESLVISTLSAGLGVLLAVSGTRLVTTWLPAGTFPHEADFHVNLPVLGFTIVIAVVVAILLGMAPAYYLSNPELSAVMSQSGSSRTQGSTKGRRVRYVLVVCQVAISVVLLSAAGAAVQAFRTLYNKSLGYDPEHVLSLRLVLPNSSASNWQQCTNSIEAIRQAVAQTPGVESVSVSRNWVPPYTAFDLPIEITDVSSAEAKPASFALITPDEFKVLHLGLVRGRVFSGPETKRAAHVALVNEALVRQYFNNHDPIGRQVRCPALKVNLPGIFTPKDPDSWLEIVGVVKDAVNEGLDRPVLPAVFIPYPFLVSRNISLLFRTNGSPGAVLNEVRHQIFTANHGVAFQQGRELSWLLWTQGYGKESFVAMVFTAFSLVALAFAVLGLYAIASHTVTQRRHELGVRIALGAKWPTLVASVLKSTASIVSIGVIAGFALTILLTRLAPVGDSANLRDPILALLVAAILLVVSAAACILPAWQILSIDPAKALRVA